MMGYTIQFDSVVPLWSPYTIYLKIGINGNNIVHHNKDRKKQVTLGDDGISLRSSERRPHTIIRSLQLDIK